MLFNRLGAVSISRGKKSDGKGPLPSAGIGTKIEGMRLAFNVVKTADSELNDIQVSIYNLSATTRAAFETAGNRIYVEAGYESTGLVLLAVGDIVKGSTSYNLPDSVTEVDARDGGLNLRNARTAVTYNSGTSAKTMVSDLIKQLEVDEVEIMADLDQAFREGWSFVGNVRDALDKLAARFGFDWSIQNNTAQITPRREPSQRTAVVLNPSSGLIGIPTRLDTTGQNQDKAKEQPGLSVRSLLNPAVLPGDPIVIEARDFPSATYRVRRVEHHGDTHGSEWYSDIEAISNLKASIDPLTAKQKLAREKKKAKAAGVTA